MDSSLPGSSPIVTAGQDWTGITPAPIPESEDPFEDFPTWAALNGITPDVFRGLKPDDQKIVASTYLKRNMPKPIPPAAQVVNHPGRGFVRSPIQRKLWQVMQTPQVNWPF
jgi:hypothetical protein